MKPRLLRVVRLVAASLAIVGVGGTMVAQESRSASLAKQLALLLDQGKLDAVAAKDPSAPDRYVAALYFQGSQLLVVSAKYSVPVLLNEKLGKKSYRDVYIDLNSASAPDSRLFVEDLQADGLMPGREENQPFDTYENGKTRVAFDSDWKGQKISEDDYKKSFAAADEAYAKMLTALIAELKKAS